MIRTSHIFALITFIALLNTFTVYSQQTGGSAYEEIILRAEQYMETGDYAKAKQEYENALGINPDASYPRIKLQQIRKTFVDPNDSRRYNNYISEGDRLFDRRDFIKAREQYFWANVLRPDEKHPRSRMKEIDEIIKDRKRKLVIFNKSVATADSLFDLNQYQQALNEYLYASGLLPGEIYPRTRIDEINKIFEEARQEQKAYNKAVEEADQLYMIQDYNAAMDAYNKALQMRPQERYPASMIDRINAMASDQRSLENVYASVVDNADRLFDETDYPASRVAYEHAMRLKPEEEYPKKRVGEIDALLEARAMSEEAFDEAMLMAMQYYENDNYESALKQFRKAEKIRNLNEEAILIVEKIEGILKEERLYNSFIAKADESFNAGDYNSARNNYTQALEKRASETYPAGRIEEIDSILANLGQMEDNYNTAISSADRAFSNRDYKEALGFFQQAAKIMPGETYPKQRVGELQPFLEILELADGFVASEQYQSALDQYRAANELLPLSDETLVKIAEAESALQTQKAYNEMMLHANELYDEGKYETAREKYQEALDLMPGSQTASDRIADIDALLNTRAEKTKNYADAIMRGDKSFDEEDFEKALEAYSQAATLKPEENYPASRISEVQEIVRQQQANQLAYNENINLADNKFNSGHYQQAISSYQEALKYMPGDSYAENRITEARNLISEAEINEAFASAVSQANFHEDNGDLISALDAWKTASGLKPEEALPKQRINELSAVVAEEKRRIQEAYDKFIADGNRHFNSRVFDQAIDAYIEAGLLKPGETYPFEMIDSIRRYIDERAIVDLVSEPVNIVSGDEKRFTFSPVEMRVRRNNYVIVTLRFNSTESSRFFLNYGLDGQRSGGIVVRNPGGKEENQFIVRVSSQDRWYRIDNNWISIYPEGSDVEITQLRISSGD